MPLYNGGWLADVFNGFLKVAYYIESSDIDFGLVLFYQRRNQRLIVDAMHRLFLKLS
jgi:hypothetical protein